MHWQLQLMTTTVSFEKHPAVDTHLPTLLSPSHIKELISLSTPPWTKRCGDPGMSESRQAQNSVYCSQEKDKTCRLQRKSAQIPQLSFLLQDCSIWTVIYLAVDRTTWTGMSLRPHKVTPFIWSTPLVIIHTLEKSRSQSCRCDSLLSSHIKVSVK